EENVTLQQRTKAAAQYFSKELQQLLQVLSKSPAVTDSSQFATDYNEDLKNIHVAVANKLHLINSCVNGFTVLNYHKQKNDFIVAAFVVNAYAQAYLYVYK